MKAGVVHAKNDIRYEEIEKPQPKKGQVLIKVKYTGICGSDVPRVNGDACHFFPNVLGHEFSGTIEEVGEGVTTLKKGDRVSIAWFFKGWFHWYHVWNVKIVRKEIILCVSITALLGLENLEVLRNM